MSEKHKAAKQARYIAVGQVTTHRIFADGTETLSVVELPPEGVELPDENFYAAPSPPLRD